MPEFYHDSVTDKSFRFLAELNKEYRFVLIGGWAVFLYTHALKSKDIDIVLDYDELGKIRENYATSKNDRLKKYEIKTGEFDVDVYVSHYSDLGVPAEYIMRSSEIREGFRVPPLEVLLVLKLYAWQRRRGSIKGHKDELDILALASLPGFSWDDYARLVGNFHLQEEHGSLLSFLKETVSVPELHLNEQQISRLKKTIPRGLK